MKKGRGEGVGISTIDSAVPCSVFEVFVWLVAPTLESAMDKERLSNCATCAISVLALSPVTSLLVGAVDALVDMSPSSTTVGIVAALVDLALRRASETCEGARG